MFLLVYYFIYNYLYYIIEYYIMKRKSNKVTTKKVRFNNRGINTPTQDDIEAASILAGLRDSVYNSKVAEMENRKKQILDVARIEKEKEEALERELRQKNKEIEDMRMEEEETRMRNEEINALKRINAENAENTQMRHEEELDNNIDVEQDINEDILYAITRRNQLLDLRKRKREAEERRQQIINENIQKEENAILEQERKKQEEKEKREQEKRDRENRALKRRKISDKCSLQTCGGSTKKKRIKRKYRKVTNKRKNRKK